MIRFFRHFGDALKGLKRNGGMSFLAMTAMTITLSFLGLFAAFIINAERLTTGVEDNVKISAVLLYDSTDNQKEIEDDKGKTVSNPAYHQVYDQIQALSEVASIEFSSKEEQLQELIASMGDEFALHEQDNPLSDVYIVSTKTPESVQEVAEAIADFSGVEDVSYGGIESERLLSLAKSVRLWGAIISGLVLFVTVFFIANTIRLTIISRSNEIQIMRLVGATKSYIRVPFFIEGALVGLFGSLIPLALIYYGYQWFFVKFGAEFVASGLSLYPPLPFVYYIMAGLAILGVLIGAFGSTLSVRKHLKV